MIWLFIFLLQQAEWHSIMHRIQEISDRFPDRGMQVQNRGKKMRAIP
jgi:hypothetical protein